MPGRAISTPRITRILERELRLVVDGRELVLPYAQFPWFEGPSVEAIRNVERPHPSHLRWPALDVDLTLRSIEHPEEYPLTARVVGPHGS